jgi:hypothetical protein
MVQLIQSRRISLIRARGGVFYRIPAIKTGRRKRVETAVNEVVK